MLYMTIPIKHKFIDGVENKLCSTCKVYSPLSNYFKFHKNWDGLNRACKTCYQKYRKENAKEMDKKRWRVVKKRLEEDKEYKEEVDRKRRDAEKVKRKTDPEWKLKKNVSRRMRELLQTKSNSTTKYLGCTIPELRMHLEKQFNEQMNWENQGSYWHIDHIIPCAAFDLSNEFEINACFNYRNLQPLEAKQNIFKKDKFNVQDKVEYLKKFN